MAARGREIVQAQFRIRPAKPTDVPALFQMKAALARAEGHEEVIRASERDWLRDGFGPNARFRAFVAEVEGRLCAMIVYNPFYMTALGGDVFAIQDLFVEPAMRKLGIGRALIAHVAAAAVGAGVPLIQLVVHEDNAARKFYRRLGFGHLRECQTYAIGGQPMLELSLTVGETLVPR
jgi:ribosomal protein S18 acetylase RimI-like enzyme